MADTEIWNNRFLVTKTAPNEHFYGVKGRQFGSIESCLVTEYELVYEFAT